MHRTHYKNKIQPYKPLDKQVQWERRKIQQLQSSSLEELWLIPQSALYKYIYRWHNIPSMSGRVSCCTSATISSKVMSKGNICWFFFLINEYFLDKINQAKFINTDLFTRKLWHQLSDNSFTSSIPSIRSLTSFYPD